MGAGTDLGPSFVNGIGKSIVANDQLGGDGVLVKDAEGERVAGQQSC
jgi:hypothetical protein